MNEALVDACLEVARLTRELAEAQAEVAALREVTMDEWELFLRKLTLERQTGMPRWNLTRAPECDVMDDSPSVVAERRRQLLEVEADEVEEAMRDNRRRLRRVA